MLHIPAEDEARKAIRILNPISENLSIMRTLLTPSMLNVIVDNLKKGNAEGRLFEMAPVYLAKELPINEHPHERQTLCIGAFGPEEDFFTVKGALEALAAGFGLTFDYQRETAAWLHPGISAAVYCNGKRLGVFGKLANEINAELEIAKEQKDSQNIYLGELDYEALMSCVEGELRYKPSAPMHRSSAIWLWSVARLYPAARSRRPSARPARWSARSSCSISIAALTLAMAKRAWPSACPCLIPRRKSLLRKWSAWSRRSSAT